MKNNPSELISTLYKVTEVEGEQSVILFHSISSCGGEVQVYSLNLNEIGKRVGISL